MVERVHRPHPVNKLIFISAGKYQGWSLIGTNGRNMLNKKTSSWAMRMLPTQPSFSREHEPRTLNVDHHLMHHLRLPHPSNQLHEARTLNVDCHLAKHPQLPHLSNWL